jgi:hypothetical protein
MQEKPRWWEKMLWIGFKWLMQMPTLYAAGMRLAPLGQKFLPLVMGTPLNPMAAWTNTREIPETSPVPFRDWMRNRKGAKK